MSFKRLFLRHYLSASAFFFGWSLSSLILSAFFSGTNQKYASRESLFQASAAFVLSIGAAYIGETERRKK
jgi:hypothetical protein